MKIKSILLTIAGLLLLVLGAVGLVIPVWPTTPFVIASVGCLSSTPRLRGKIVKIPFFREHIENYRSRKGLDRKTLAISLIFLWGMLLLSMALVHKTVITVILSVVGISVTIHILCVARPKKKREDGNGDSRGQKDG